MAGANNILRNLCAIQGTNFEVTDCKVKENEIVWRIEHQAKAVYICSSCGKENTSCHDSKWITLRDQPFGLKPCKWLV